MMPGQKPEVKLLTLLNVSAVKRPRKLDQPGGFRSPSASRAQSISVDGEDSPATAPKRRRTVVWGGEIGPSGSTYGKTVTPAKNGAASTKAKGKAPATSDEDEHDEDEEMNGSAEEDAGAADSDDEETTEDTFNTHFGPTPRGLEEAVKTDKWDTSRRSLKGLGRVVEQVPAGLAVSDGKARLVPSIAASVNERKATTPLLPTLLGHLGSYADLYAHSLDGEAEGRETAPFAPTSTREALRAATAAHAVNHVLKTRRRIVRNNEKLAHAADAGNDIETPRDQSFTRPKVLFLLPTRAMALHWLREHVFPLAGPGTQVENRRPFEQSFGLPADEVDPLLKNEAGLPVDHLENFRGNTDDNFRFGVKITRKAWRVVMPPANEAKLMDCDFLIASPLAIKMAAEKENSTDVLASIEIVVVDGLDVLEMQNWDHTQFVFNHLNEIPKAPHGCDFSRVKPWYLEANARKLRQTLLFGRYDMPEARALVRACENIAGKRRLDAVGNNSLPGVLERVRPGVRQVFERIDADVANGSAASAAMAGPAAGDEADARLDMFTKKTLPALLRSAVSRQQTLVVVPSYFDFVRVTNYLRKADVASYAAVSEYSSNAEISRARTLFFKGKKALLVVTERFHFYRRYRLRGARTVVWYQLPSHAAFYAEMLATPFIGNREAEAAGMEEVDASEVSSRALISRFDVLRLERIVGQADARRMLGSSEARFEFV